MGCCEKFPGIFSCRPCIGIIPSGTAGWFDWATNGTSYGETGFSCGETGIVAVPKGAAVPEGIAGGIAGVEGAPMGVIGDIVTVLDGIGEPGWGGAMSIGWNGFPGWFGSESVGGENELVGGRSHGETGGLTATTRSTGATGIAEGVLPPNRSLVGSGCLANEPESLGPEPVNLESLKNAPASAAEGLTVPTTSMGFSVASSLLKPIKRIPKPHNSTIAPMAVTR